MGVEEVRNPRRTMPLAITVGMSLVTALFVLTNVAYSVVLTIPEIQESDAVAMVRKFWFQALTFSFRNLQRNRWGRRKFLFHFLFA
jgi:amino acid transporter